MPGLRHRLGKFHHALGRFDPLGRKARADRHRHPVLSQLRVERLDRRLVWALRHLGEGPVLMRVYLDEFFPVVRMKDGNTPLFIINFGDEINKDTTAMAQGSTEIVDVMKAAKVSSPAQLPDRDP